MKAPFAVLLVLLALAVATGSAGAGENESGFKSSQAAMLAAPSGTVTPIITVGETVKGLRFESIPDGIAMSPRGQGVVDVFVNHETSTVPFPYTPGAGPGANQNDFDNAQLSRWRLNQHSAGILSGSMAITSSENWQRFCSNYLATAKEGFERPLLFTNEEATDFVFRTGQAWPAPASEPPAQQAGVVVAHDPKSGETRPILGMGRHNHENSVAIPGYGHPVVLSGDDTFTSNPAQSQLYSYIAPSANAVWNDQGKLYGFRAKDHAAFNDYYDFPIGSTMSVPGEFVEIPRPAAVGTQSQLEAASDAAEVFQFVRLEDIAYDKRPGKQNVVYVADTGRGATSAGGNAFTSTNGRVWKLVFNPSNPREATLSILIEGDDAPVKTLNEIHQPDNLETTQRGLYITEDPGSSQQFPFGSADPNATTARVWRHDLASGVNAPVMWVDQSADEGPTDVDPRGRGNLGAWEASGIIDASSVFGAGVFLINVQAHTLWVEKQEAPDWTYKREGGQLLLVRLPNA